MSVHAENWVSKTDLTRYLRCPYAFYLLDRGLVAFEDTVSEQQARLVAEGINFQTDIEAVAVPRTIDPTDLPRVFSEESIRLFRVPVFENPALEIYGKPDAIDTAQGALMPVEVKSHKGVQRSDELELAFYWMLLEPRRTRAISPRGYLLLRRNGVDEQVEIEIRPHRFEQVHALLREIRDARAHGVPPRICRCTVCSRFMRDKIDRATLAKKDLTRLWGIGPVYARRLEEIGIKGYDELLGVDSASVADKLRKNRCSVSPAQVDRWKHHAVSYSTCSPVLFGDPLKLGGQFLALDLEYEPGGFIWLVGVCLVRQSGRDYLALWADTPAQEESNLKHLADIAAGHPSLPVITWNGNAADIPQLRSAVRRLNLGQVLYAVYSRHLDLYHHAKNALRFPIPSLALGEVASYFAIPRVSRIRDGLEALFLFQEYRACRDDNRREALKTDLLEYNRDDLEALVEVAERISGLQCSSQKVPNGELRGNNLVSHEFHRIASLRGECTTRSHAESVDVADRPRERQLLVPQRLPPREPVAELGAQPRVERRAWDFQSPPVRYSSMKLRMYPIAVEVTEQEEIVISQERKDASEPGAVTITMEQVDFLHELLQQACKEIEHRREKQEEKEDEDQGFPGRRR
jgi:predicted RecB family nuclease